MNLQQKSNSEKSLPYTEISLSEMKDVNHDIENIFNTIYSDIEKGQKNLSLKELNKDVEEKCIRYRANHMDRMKDGQCDPESGLIYEKVLISLERVSSYLTNAGKLMVA